MHDSAPPATITSASPKAMKQAASPMKWAPVVQAVDTAWLGPFLLLVAEEQCYTKRLYLEAMLHRYMASCQVD